MPRLRRRDRAIDAAPRHHRRALGQPALQYLVPADQPAALGFEPAAEAADEPALQRVLVLDPERAHPRLHLRRRLPLVLHRLVAADMDEAAREELDHLGEHILQEAERLLLDIVEPGEDAPIGLDSRRRRDARAQLRIGPDRGERVARHVDLRHDRDRALGRIGDDLADLFLGVIAAGARQRRRAGCGGGRAPCPDLGQPRIFVDLDPPALIVGQMPVKRVELVRGHPVDEPLDELGRLEVPRAVKHQPAPAEARRVLDPDRRDRLPRARELPERHAAVEEPGVVRGCHRRALRRHLQAIALLGRPGSTNEADRPFSPNLKLCPARAPEQLRKAFGGVLSARIAFDPDRCGFRQRERPLPRLHRPRLGQQRRRRRRGAGRATSGRQQQKRGG